MEIRWDEFTPEDFERLCYHILEVNGFTNLKWYGKSGNDKGRDILGIKVDNPLPSINKQSSWVIQCKRYISKPPNKGEIASFLNSAREFKPDNVLLMISNTLTSNMKDWLEFVKGEFNFNIYLWEEQDLIIQIIRHKDELSDFFPKNKALTKQVVFFKRSTGQIALGCNEFNDADILCYNCSNYEEAKKTAIEFINFIKDHDINFE